MKFTPKTEEEIQRSRLLPKGPYPFTVAESGEQASKSEKNPGRMMVALKLLIHAPGGDVSQRDFFADWFSEHKLRHFADSVGRLAEYDRGDIDFKQNRFQGATGYLYLGESKNKKTEELENKVSDYLTKEDYEAEREKLGLAAAPSAAAEESDIPF